jgi:flagellar hook-associated protein 1 FlgK
VNSESRFLSYLDRERIGTMALSSALYNAYSGLRANSTRAEVAANNIANAQTKGFARREVILSSSAVGDRGNGVIVEGVRIAKAAVLTEDRWRTDAERGDAKTAHETAMSLARIIGGADDDGSLFKRYAQFEDSLRLFSGDPAASHLQTDVYNKALDIVHHFNDMNERLLNIRSNLDTQIGDAIDDLNTALQDVAELNVEIRRDLSRGIHAHEKISQRNMRIDDISELVQVRTFEREDGSMLLMTRSGHVLVDDNPVQIDFSRVGTVSAEMDWVGGNPNGISGVTVHGQDVTPPHSSVKFFTKGKIAAMFAARDVTTVDFQKKIDGMAEDLITRFRDPAVEPHIDDGENGLFDVVAGDPDDRGAAAQLRINPLVAAQNNTLHNGIGAPPLEPGDNAHILQLIDALTATGTPPVGTGISGQQSATDLVAQISSLLAEDYQSAEREMSLTVAKHAVTVSTEAAAIGVDVDYELQEMTLIQNAYAANAKVMQVIDDMLKEVLKL